MAESGNGTARISLAIIAATLVACATPVKGLFPPRENAPSKIIYLVSHGWHAGIVLQRTDLAPSVCREYTDFPHGDYLEVGWGDRDYYRTPNPSLGVALKAALWPTPSVLHIVGFSGPVTAYFASSEIIEIALSHEGFERLCRYIGDSFALNEEGDPLALGAGLYGNSQFYRSKESYHAFKTCNVWTAGALRAAGCPIRPFSSVGVESLMSRARSFGRLIQSRPSTDRDRGG